MNKKGYTLIEILMVVAILFVIGLGATIGLEKVITNSKKDRYDNMLEEIKEATNTYITVFEPQINENLYTSGSVMITIEELQDALLLDDMLKNPKDNTLVEGNIVITYDSLSESISYNITITSE